MKFTAKKIKNRVFHIVSETGKDHGLWEIEGNVNVSMGDEININGLKGLVVNHPKSSEYVPCICLGYVESNKS